MALGVDDLFTRNRNVGEHLSVDIKEGPNDVPITTTVSPNG